MLRQLITAIVVGTSLLSIDSTSAIEIVDRDRLNSPSTFELQQKSNQKANYEDYRQELLESINNVRKERGLASLEFSDDLALAAQKHAQDLTANNLFSHTGSDGSTVADRVLAIGYDYSSVGENVAAGKRTPEKVFRQWMNSPGHKDNMLGSDFTEAGIGYVLDASDTTYNHYWVLVLGKEF